MTRRGLTFVEVLVGAVVMALLATIGLAGFHALGRQSGHATESLARVQEALLLLETIRLELASIVMNPFADPRDHEDNSFVISRPHGTSIQFVTERREGGDRRRHLVYYEATDRHPPGGSARGLSLRKVVWRFDLEGTWNDRIRFPPGWPEPWIGPVVATEDRRWERLGIQDLRWQYLVPSEGEGRVYFRIKLVLRGPSSGRLEPYTTLVAVPTPDLPATVSDCPCMFAPCFQPSRPRCDCCNGPSLP